MGHFYSLNLLRHLAAGEGWHEHDMSALKRIKPKGLRQGVPKGRRVLLIEKVFDALKNKLGETKAWATSLGSRATQAQFLMRTHNRLLLYEQVLA